MLDDYSADEIEVHYEAAIRQRASRTKELACAVRMAMHGKKNQFSKFMSELEKTGERIDKAAGRFRQFDVGNFLNTLNRIGGNRRGKHG